MFTERGIYESINIELNKVEAPSLLLSDYNYFINKAKDEWQNLRYNIYDTSQQTTDDLQVLRDTVVIPSTQFTRDSNNYYTSFLPENYFHLLNCIVEYQVTQKYKCYSKGELHQRQAKKLTSDNFAYILNNAFMRPSYERPYFFILNNTNPIYRSTTPLTKAIPTTSYVSTTYPATNWQNNTTVTTNSLDSLAERVRFDYSDGSYKVVHTFTKEVNDAPNFVGIIKGVIVKYYLLRNTPITGYTPSGTDPDEPGVTEQKIGSTELLGNLVYLAQTYYEFEILDIEQTNQAGLYVGRLDRFQSPFDNTFQQLSQAWISENNELLGKSNGNVQLQIRYGKDSSVFQLKNVYVDYLKTPQPINLTQAQLDMTLDTSRVLEFPDYVCREIIKIATRLILENMSDPRTQSNMAINQTIPQQIQQ